MQQGVEWSTERVLESTLQNCSRIGVQSDSTNLPTLQDIDTVEVRAQHFC